MSTRSNLNKKKRTQELKAWRNNTTGGLRTARFYYERMREMNDPQFTARISKIIALANGPLAHYIRHKGKISRSKLARLQLYKPALAEMQADERLKKVATKFYGAILAAERDNFAEAVRLAKEAYVLGEDVMI